jgi:hypothetical protein
MKIKIGDFPLKSRQNQEQKASAGSQGSAL